MIWRMAVESKTYQIWVVGYLSSREDNKQLLRTYSQISLADPGSTRNRCTFLGIKNLGNASLTAQLIQRIPLPSSTEFEALHNHDMCTV